MKRLAPLIGTWDTEDIYRPESPTPSIERGVRRCAYALGDRYIECVTMATNARGLGREYRFYITWDPERGRYTMLSIWSNVGGLQLTTFAIDSTGREWDIRGTAPYVENGIERRTWSTLTFAAPDSIVWLGRYNLSSDSPTSWPVSFRETWRRRR
ncbi:MAG: hypothetical protein HOP28_10180 [Gemmatimonadales bacterium]|nr:hypothetical protein [Gemmatimonadales bacterium]